MKSIFIIILSSACIGILIGSQGCKNECPPASEVCAGHIEAQARTIREAIKVRAERDSLETLLEQTREQVVSERRGKKKAIDLYMSH